MTPDGDRSAIPIIESARIWGRLAARFRQEPGLGLTLGYGLLTLSGMTFERFLLAYFGVNILDYTEFGDFLTVALRHPAIIGSTFFAIGVLTGVLNLDVWLRKRYPSYDAWYVRLESYTAGRAFNLFMQVLTLIVYFGLLTHFYAKQLAGQIHQGHTRRVAIELSNGKTYGSVENGSGGVVVITTTSKYLFIYRQEDSTTHVLPVDSVIRIVSRP